MKSKVQITKMIARIGKEVQRHKEQNDWESVREYKAMQSGLRWVLGEIKIFHDEP